MKTNIILFFLLSLSCVTKAQTSVCPALQSFNGEWRYVNGQDTIRIYLRYHDCWFGGGSYELLGSLWGWHEYKRGNVVIESNYSNRFMSLPANYDNVVNRSYSILLSLPNCDINEKRLLGNIDDISQCYESKVVKARFNAALNQIVWQQTHGEGFGVFTGCKGMTLPKYFVLTKQ